MSIRFYSKIFLGEFFEKKSLKNNSLENPLNKKILPGFVNVFYITDHGIPFINLNNGTAYSYSKKMDSWMVVNSNDAITKCGMASGNVTNVKNMKIYPLATVQYISNSFQQKQKVFSEM